ncbi:MAG TPA: chaperone modulator CbpM [Chitinophagaceae bacterium]|nr:chaperone modulator CbpM [Chitinophagaceae bacterium]
MENEYLIPADEFCTHYNVEFSFINTLQEYGLIEMISIEENYFIDVNQLQRLEQYTRLHYDLDINVEGIEVIEHLLNRVRNLQDEIISLQNRLRLYEQSSRRFF